MKKKSTIKLLNLGIKAGVFILLAGALFYQIVRNKELGEVKAQFLESLDNKGLLLFGIVVFLMFINWGMEALKWHTLVGKFQKLPFLKTYQAIFSGITLGIFTPNRIGEYGGRMFYVRRRNRIKAIAVTLIGSFSQILITVGLGIIFLPVFLWWHYDLSIYMNAAILSASVLLLLMLGFFYYNLQTLVSMLGRFAFFRKIKKQVEIIGAYSKRELTVILLFSFLRYAAFTAQYIVLLYIYGVGFSFLHVVVTLGLVFFVQSVIPSFAIAEWVTRGNIALFFINFYSDNHLAIIAASTSLWLINLIFPAVVGYLFISRYNFLK